MILPDPFHMRDVAERMDHTTHLVCYLLSLSCFITFLVTGWGLAVWCCVAWWLAGYIAKGGRV